MSVESNRARFYLRKKEYRAQVRSKKGAYLYQLNEKINNGKNINWAALKDLSSTHKDPDTFDLYDLVPFHKFSTTSTVRSARIPPMENNKAQRTTPADM